MTTGGVGLRPGERAAAHPAPVALAPLGAVALAVTAVLVAASGGYGYHRDELYFLESGRHLAFGYVDQPPLTPLLARMASEQFGGSLTGLRLAPALAAGLTVLVTGLIARELGGGRGAQALAAGCIAVAACPLAVGTCSRRARSTCWPGRPSRGWWSLLAPLAQLWPQVRHVG